MTTKLSALQSRLPSAFVRLPTIVTAGVLSTGLLLSGCSNNDKGEAETAAHPTSSNEDTAAVAKTSENDGAGQAVLKDSEDKQVADNNKDKTTIANDNMNPVTASAKQKSLVSNPTQHGTPEDTVKKALDSLYYGDAKQAATYYKVDMANFEEELAKTQSAFQQTVDGVTFTDTKYSDNKTRATITGELMLRGQSEPTSLTYELQKIDGKWKILG